jgi:autotransporter translocation and assembly factor TamB
VKKPSPFLIFVCIVFVLVTSAMLFIQSKTFAHVFKGVIAKYLPKDMGIDADFSEFAIKMYPPGLSLKNPHITLRDRNILKLPAGSSVRAERIDFDFRPLQMFTGDVRVHELVIVGGDVNLLVQEEAEPKVKKPGVLKQMLVPKFHWDELFQVHAEAVVIQDSKARVEWIGTGNSVELQVKNLRLGQWMGRGGLGYEFKADLTGLGGSVLDSVPVLKSLDNLQATAHINALGVQLDSVHLRAKGLEVQGDGMVRGNLQNPKDGLSLEADLSSQADIGLIASAINPTLGSSSKSAPQISGSALFTGRVRGNLMKALETLKLQGEFAAKDFQFRKFHADEIKASGTWTSSATGGEIDLEKAVIMERESLRAPGHPASGGQVEVGALKMKIGSSDPVKVKLNLDKANVQWLAALGLADLNPVFPLLFKASGPIEAWIAPPAAKRPFSLKAQLKLKIDDFLLDNQKLTQNRPQHRIFKIPTFSLEGPLVIDGTGIHPEGITLEVARTKLKLAGGIHFEKGFDLYGSGTANLADLGEVAENTIRGEGQVAVHVHGPAQRLMIDVDVDAKNAYYIHLNLGDIKGRITWDDDHNYLFLHKMSATKGATEYGVDGRLDLGKSDSIALKATIGKGNIQDFIQIFAELTQNLWWFPQSLSGPFTGELDIDGGIDLKELQILGRLNGNSWDLLGERFAKVTMLGGYNRGKYYVSDFKATKHNGRIAARIEYDDDNFDWDLHTSQFTVSDLDHIAQLDVPIRGKIQIDSTGQGKLGNIQSNSRALLNDLLVRGVPMPPSQLTLVTSGGVHRARGTLLGNQGELDAVYDFNPTHTSRINAELRHLDFSPMLLLLNPKSITDPQLQGIASGAIRLSFSSGQIERADGDVSIKEYVLAKTGTKFQLGEPVSFKVNDGTFELPKLRILSSASNPSRNSEALVHLSGKKSELNGRVSGNVDVSLAEFVTSAVQRAAGAADLDFKIGGNLKAPTLTGEARPQNATVWVQGLESPFENVTGAFQIRQNAIYVQGLEGDLAGGRASASGTILLFADRYPLISLKGDLSGNKLRFFPFQYAKVRGSMSVTGDHLPYLVEGKFDVESALSREKVLQQKQATGLKAVQYTPPPTSQRQSDYPKFKLKIDAVADKGILVQNDLFDAELKAKVTLVNTLEAPRLLGSAELVQGKMIFKDRVFQIQSASGIFDNPTVINPKFNLAAKTDLNGVKIQLYASGTMDDYKIELSSTPVMSETDILSLLALGITPNETKRMSSADRSTVESGEAASLILHSLDFNREVQDKTGIQIHLDESTNTQVGSSVFQRQNSNDATTAPRIVIKKQLTKNLDISYGSTVGVGTASERQINAEMKVSPGFSVIGVWDNYESIDSTQEKNTSYSYGLDLKLQKRFK